MPLHKELEYTHLHYTHPRHTIEDGENITIQHDVQYVIYDTLTLGDESGIVLESGADLLLV